jgi:type VI protein secretion system component Hcp
VFHVVIDPKRLNRQYTVNLNASCGLGTIPQMRAPNALSPTGTRLGSAPQQASSGIPLGGSIGHVPSGGIKIAKPQNKGQYMLVQGVHGDSKDLAHQGWIDLLSLYWGAHMGSGIANARGRAASLNCKPTDVTVTKYSDASDPALQKLAVQGTSVDVTIAEPARTVKLHEARITSVAPAQGMSGADGRMRESVTLVGCS